jgi:hypothetical protein
MQEMLFQRSKFKKFPDLHSSRREWALWQFFPTSEESLKNALLAYDYIFNFLEYALLAYDYIFNV